MKLFQSPKYDQGVEISPNVAKSMQIQMKRLFIQIGTKLFEVP